MARFRISITHFLWLASSILLLVFIAVGVNYLGNMAEIGGKATEVREKNLPEIMESQRSFTNIESLRRIAEIAYITEDPDKRRTARINAQALAAESVFIRDDGFHERALHLAELIGQLAKHRDEAHENGLYLQKLTKEYSRSILQMAAYIPNMQVTQKVLQSYFATSLPMADAGGLALQHIDKMEQVAEADQQHMRYIQEQCEYYSVLYSSLGPECVRLREMAQEYETTRRSLFANVDKSRRQWEAVDSALREVRDNVGTDAEFVITDALSAIETTSDRARKVSLWIFAGGLFVFAVYLFALQWLIVRPVRWTGQKLMDIQSGKLDGYMPMIRITEMYQVAHLLDHFSGHLAELYVHASQLEEDAAEKRDLEELMRVVFQATLDGYCVWAKGRLIKVNQGLLRLLGVEDPEVLRGNRQVFGFSSPQELDAVYETVLDQGIQRKELQLRTASGENLPCEVTYLPVYIQGSMCILSYFRDMREQKRTEQELLAAKEAAEAAAREKSDFLARMSHEIRTPMNGVLGLTQVALGLYPPPEQRNYLEKIQASARILLGVINDILDFSRIERGRVALEHVTFSFSGMLSTVADLFRSQAEQKGLYFTVKADPRIPDVLQGDELRLSQVLLNLCGNAVKFTEKGGIALRIKLLKEDSDRVVLHFAVSDTGVGMTDRQMEKLFQPFAQADTSTTRKYGGSGLGLVISKLLVEMMQGKIEVESIPTMGSTFSFTIALQKSAGGKNYCELRLSGNKKKGDLRGKSILLVEDNEINQEIAVSFLEGMGLRVLVASNGAEALEILGREDVDGVLMDIQMPVMDGLTAAREIRENGRDSVKTVPIIAMTAHAMWEDREKSLAAGMNDHITKPIDVDELGDKLTYWLL